MGNSRHHRAAHNGFRSKWKLYKKILFFGLLEWWFSWAWNISHCRVAKEFQTAKSGTTALIEARAREAVTNGEDFDKRQNCNQSRGSRASGRAGIGREDSHFFLIKDLIRLRLQSDREGLQEKRFSRGASTISQQLAKNLYLSESENPPA